MAVTLYQCPTCQHRVEVNVGNPDNTEVWHDCPRNHKRLTRYHPTPTEPATPEPTLFGADQ